MGRQRHIANCHKIYQLIIATWSDEGQALRIVQKLFLQRYYCSSKWPRFRLRSDMRLFSECFKCRRLSMALHARILSTTFDDLHKIDVWLRRLLAVCRPTPHRNWNFHFSSPPLLSQSKFLTRILIYKTNISTTKCKYRDKNIRWTWFLFAFWLQMYF